MRILHVLQTVSPPGRPHRHDRDPGSDAAMLACAHATSAFPEIEHDFCLIGGSNAERRAELAGLHTTTRLTPPGGQAALGRQSFGRLLRDHGQPDLIHCWTPSGLLMAQAASKLAIPVVASGFAPPPRVAGRVLGRPDRVVLLADEDRGAWTEQGAGKAPRYLLDVARPDLVGPGDGRNERRAEARQSHGLPSEGVGVVLLGDPPSDADAHRFAFMLGLLNVSGINAWGVVSSFAGAQHRTRRLLQRAGQLAPPLFECSGPIGPALIRACDFAFAFAPARGRAGAIAWQIATAHALGVATAGPQALHSLGMHADGLASRCLARVDLSSELALRLIDLASNRDADESTGSLRHAEAVNHRATHTKAIAEAWSSASGRAVRPTAPSEIEPVMEDAS